MYVAIAMYVNSISNHPALFNRRHHNMALQHGALLFAIVFLQSAAVTLGRTPEPFLKYRADSDDCGMSHSQCSGDLPDCCTGHKDGYYLEWCCDKFVWRYFVYGGIPLLAAFVFFIWWKFPDCFERTFGRVWGCVVSCMSCSWIKRNFVNEGGPYQTIE